MVTDTIDKFGRLDGLVNNGGGQFWSPAENISPGGFHAVVDTNLKGSWNCMQEAYHQYMGENGGKIVNIVLMSEMGLAGMSHSAAAREAVKNLAITLGAEWAGNNIQINCVAPGIFPSETAVAAYGEQVNNTTMWRFNERPIFSQKKYSIRVLQMYQKSVLETCTKEQVFLKEHCHSISFRRFCLI